MSSSKDSSLYEDSDLGVAKQALEARIQGLCIGKGYDSTPKLKGNVKPKAVLTASLFCKELKP